MRSKEEKADLRIRMMQTKYAGPLIALSASVIVVVIGLVIWFLVNAALFGHNEIQHTEYWPLRFLLIPFMAVGWGAIVGPVILLGIAAVAELCILIPAMMIRKNRVKNVFVIVYSVISLIHIILGALVAVANFVMIPVLLTGGDEFLAEFIAVDNLSIMCLAYGLVSLVYALVYITVHIATAVRAGKEVLQNTDSISAPKKVEHLNPAMNTLSILSLIFGSISAVVFSIMTIALIIVGVWKRHPVFLWTGVFCVFPLIGLLFALAAFISGAVKEHHAIKRRAAVALGLNLYSIPGAMLVFGLVVICLLRWFFMDTFLSFDDQKLFALEEKYGEEFILVSGYYAAPKSNPEIRFKGTDGQDPYTNDYRRAFVAGQIEEKLQNEIGGFYPEAFIYVDPDEIYCNWDHEFDFRKNTLKENLQEISPDGRKGSVGSYCTVRIYLNSDVGTKRLYQQEYAYFTRKMQEDIENHEMIPIEIYYYWVDDDTVYRAERFYEKYPAKSASLFDEDVLRYESELRQDYANGDIGNPPVIYTCFIPTYPAYEDMQDEKEFVYRRKLLESK